MTLEQLRDRLKAAKGPDRDIDEALALYLGWRSVDTKDGVRYWLEPRAVGAGLDMDLHRNRLLPFVHLAFPLRFTGSLDAAVALVPAEFEHFWSVGDESEAARLFARFGYGIEVTAATPALALCLARVEFEIAKAKVPT